MRIALLIALFAAIPAHAQTSGALDMGQLTGTLSMDSVTRSERARADARRSSSAPAISPATRERLKSTCRRMRGRGDAGTGLADYRKFDAMCLRYGY